MQILICLYKNKLKEKDPNVSTHSNNQEGHYGSAHLPILPRLTLKLRICELQQASEPTTLFLGFYTLYAGLLHVFLKVINVYLNNFTF